MISTNKQRFHFYDANNFVFINQSIASANTILSSLTALAKDIVYDYFPNNYFKHYNVSTARAASNQNKNDLYDNKLDKIKYPSLTLSPEITLEDPVGIGRHTLLSDPSLYMRKDPRGVHREVLKDPNSVFSVYSMSDYITVNVYGSIKLRSFNEAVRQAYNLKAKLPTGFHFRNNKPISVELPKTYANLLAEMNSIGGIYDNKQALESDIEKLQVYLNSICRTDSSIKLTKDLSSGKWCFFYETFVNVYTIITDINVPNQVIRNNSSEGDYEISFRIQMSCWSPNNFIFQIDRNMLAKTLMGNAVLKEQLSSQNTGADGQLQYTADIIHLTLDYKDVDYFTDTTGTEWIGQNIIHQKYTYNPDYELTQINLTKLFKDDLIKLHSFARSKNIELTNLFHISITSDVEADINYETLTINFNSQPYSNFILNVWINKALYLSLLEAINKDLFYFTQYALTTVDVQYTDPQTLKLVSNKVKVYKFKNDQEMYDTDPDKAFRINTIYGVGYFGLVPEGHALASPFKICTAIDTYGNPIIRCLELVD